MSATTTAPRPGARRTRADRSDPDWIPPLQSGDRLTRDEFERRYHAMPETVKAELIRGVVYVMASPVRAVGHGEEQANVVGLLFIYKSRTPGVRVFDNSTVRLSEDTEPQPDAAMLIAPDRGGQATLAKDGYIEGAPELAIEIPASSASYDLHDKLQEYERRGVREYVVWRVFDDAIDWFELVGGSFVRREPDATGLHKSVVFSGFWLNPGALLDEDLPTLIDGLHQGLASPEHAAFVERLKAAGPAS